METRSLLQCSLLSSKGGKSVYIYIIPSNFAPAAPLPTTKYRAPVAPSTEWQLPSAGEA